MIKVNVNLYLVLSVLIRVVKDSWFVMQELVNVNNVVLIQIAMVLLLFVMVHQRHVEHVMPMLQLMNVRIKRVRFVLLNQLQLVNVWNV